MNGELRGLAAQAASAYDALGMVAINSSPILMLRQKAELMSAADIQRSLLRLAHEIVESNGGTSGLGLIGIRRRGVPLAQRLGKLMERIEGASVPMGELEINFYREDLSTVASKPVVQTPHIDFPLGDRNLILVDDVLFTGRTMHAAVDALLSQERSCKMQLCVLIDRGHRELPIEAAYVGRKVPTTMNEVIEVKLTEIDQVEKVLLMEK